jgi:hypothetical protein
MLDEKTFNDFIDEVDKAYQLFNYWKYTNNKIYVPSEKWLVPAEIWQNKKVPKFGKFWRFVGVSLQDMWILAVARLFDPSSFRDQKRLSIYYLLNLLNDDIFKNEVELRLQKHKSYMDSVKNYRNNFLAHKSVDALIEDIAAGIEAFFEEVNKIVSEIKNKETHLKNCRDIYFQDIEKSCEDDVEKVLRILQKN